ncbi:autotransporter outer membrane beta-barrel domain-containing protein [Synechococcus sp. MVIR-18-1]|uniref:autotransporter outer membrane beta-barrel domain-containing protein n=1 Tax=Synechococcus sp. MVIR-18-1 TaxID=1386941 RepID=UPI0016449B1C|nr:autotransporter outer membrane beta-barrel domain-containing protein [Synechococcus sp. MVIR-18-1]
MKLRHFTVTAFGAVVACSFLPKAMASDYNLVKGSDGKVYCIGTTTGTYYFAGENVKGFGINGNTDRAEYSSTVPVNPENGNNGKVDKGLETNRNHWSNEGQSVWGFDYYTNGSSNKVAKSISQVISLQFPTGIGSANRLRGFEGGTHQPNVLDKEVRAYTVENVAYSVSLNLCEYEYSDDIPPVNLEKTWYTSKELLTGQVRPVFEGGTLLFDKNALYSDDNFVVNNVIGNAIHNNDLNIELRGVLSGQGGLSFLGNGTTTLSGANSYIGDTNILSGIFKVTGSLSDVTAVSVSQGAVYKVASTDTVGSIEGAGDIQVFPGKVLTTGGNNRNTTFSGYLRGDGGLSKIGSGVLTISGSKNDYLGSTTISGGTLRLGNPKGIPQASATVVNYGGTLDLNNQSPVIDSLALNGGNGSGTLDDILKNTAKIQGGNLPGTITSNGGMLIGITGTNAILNATSGRTFLRDGVNLGTGSLTGGQLWAADDDTAAFTNFTLNTVAVVPNEPGKGAGLGTNNPGLVVGFGEKDSYSMRIGVDAQGNDNGGRFTYTGGNVYLFNPVTDADRNSDRSQYEGTWNVLDFTEGDLTAAEYSTMFSNTYLLLVAPDGSDYDYLKFNAAGVPVDPKGATREVELVKGSLKVNVGGVNPNARISNFCGSAQGGLSQDMFNQFPLMSTEDFSEGARRGFCPRNIDAAGQAMANYNNLLADTIFERTPMRRFTEVEVAAVEPVTELEVEPVVEPAVEPVRGLWSKSGELNDAAAGEYLEQKVDPQPLVIADAQIAADHQEQHVIEVNGRTYAEDDSLTAEYADVEGVRGWFRGFGGSSGDYNGETGTVYNPYGISGGGGVVGADVSLSESFQLGAYANYGDISLWQTNSGDTFGGGGWNADGWGGGITADYWTNNFYVQGLLGATGFSGEQRRTINEYGAMYTAGTAKGEKSSSSMVGALRIGAPFQSGSTYFEPQFTATWSGNNENRFSESADDDRLGLTYKGRNTNYLQTALGMKFAWPMKTGDTGLLTPSVKLAWLGDWNMGNEDQTIGFGFSDKTYSVGSNQENQNGGLIEAGLDYSVAKIESTTVKAYLRGGAEVWGGNRGTNWRASGGMTFQF